MLVLWMQFTDRRYAPAPVPLHLAAWVCAVSACPGQRDRSRHRRWHVSSLACPSVFRDVDFLQMIPGLFQGRSRDGAIRLNVVGGMPAEDQIANVVKVQLVPEDLREVRRGPVQR